MPFEGLAGPIHDKPDEPLSGHCAVVADCLPAGLGRGVGADLNRGGAHSP